MKLRLPKNHLTGMKIYCPTCRKDNPKRCRHEQKYKVRVHVPGTKHDVRSKELESLVYSEAAQEALDFINELKNQNFQRIIEDDTKKTRFTLPEAVLFYYRYLNGEHPLAHKRREAPSKRHIQEFTGYCSQFVAVVKQRVSNIEQFDVRDISDVDISRFHEAISKKYTPVTANKVRLALTQLIDLMINEGVEMKNPFLGFITKRKPIMEIETLTQGEFLSIIREVEKDTLALSEKKKLNSDGKAINMEFYRPYLVNVFWAGLLFGVRREELFTVKWNQLIEYNGIRFFKIHNLKVERIRKKEMVYKYIPVNIDLQEFLDSIGYAEKSRTDEYILCPNRKETIGTLMAMATKAFTFYKTRAKIDKKVFFKTLRKNYVTLMNYHMGQDTGKLTSQSERVIVENYVDPKMVSVIEKAALSVRLFEE